MGETRKKFSNDNKKHVLPTTTATTAATTTAATPPTAQKKQKELQEKLEKAIDQIRNKTGSNSIGKGRGLILN